MQNILPVDIEIDPYVAADLRGDIALIRNLAEYLGERFESRPIGDTWYCWKEAGLAVYVNHTRCYFYATYKGRVVVDSRPPLKFLMGEWFEIIEELKAKIKASAAKAEALILKENATLTFGE